MGMPIQLSWKYIRVPMNKPVIPTLSETEQLQRLSKANVTPFSKRVSETSASAQLRANDIEIFQMNVGKLCNLSCSHCHVEAGPDKTEENMSREIFEKCLAVIKQSEISTIDLTGGAPEMNPHLEWFITELSALNRRVIVRSNLTVLGIPKYAHFLDLFADTKTEVVASLPCYTADTTDKQRGTNVFKKSITILQELNKRGYGKEGTGLALNLVHNPVGAHLPPEQTQLEADYKQRLYDDFRIEFNHLFCITNMPISRYLEYLIADNKFNDYMALLLNAYNPAALDSVMCRNTISIKWDGSLYDCDFNQMLALPIGHGAPTHINDWNQDQLTGRRIALANHCYGCTAGAGSSCQGSLS